MVKAFQDVLCGPSLQDALSKFQRIATASYSDFSWDTLTVSVGMDPSMDVAIPDHIIEKVGE